MRFIQSILNCFRTRPAKDLTRVETNDVEIRCIRPDGRIETIAWTDLQSVIIETNDRGPFEEDVYFQIQGPHFGFRIPQLADGTSDLVTRLGRLPGFDHDTFLKAMCSTSVAQYICWQKSAT